MIVDSGYPGHAEAIVRNLRKNSLAPASVSLMLITHGHIDHYGSAAEMRGLTGAPIAMHEADAQDVRASVNSIGTPVGLVARLFKSILIRRDRFPSQPLEVDIVIRDEMDLVPYGIDGTVIPTPGHTEGSLSVILSSGEAVVGDLVMGGFVRSRAPRPPLFLTNKLAWQESIRRVLGHSPRMIYAGHGGPFTPDALRRLIE